MDGRISNFGQVASVRRYVYTEGREKGLEVIDCDNGNIRFLLNVSKALDIMQLYHRGQNISFLSKNAFTLKDDGFVKRFEGGMLYTCGLENVGDRPGFPLHGSFHNIAAHIIHMECNEKHICVEAVIHDTALFGKNLVMHRKYTADIMSDNVILEDTLENCGYKEEDYCLLYHINIGYPMLDEKDVLKANIKKFVSRTPWAEINKDTMSEIQCPEPNMEECCYFIRLDKGMISLYGKKNNKTFTLEYSSDTLPYLVEWKSMACGDYALGLEPCTTLLDDKFEYKKIKPDEKIVFKVKLKIK